MRSSQLSVACLQLLAVPALSARLAKRGGAVIDTVPNTLDVGAQVSSALDSIEAAFSVASTAIAATITPATSAPTNAYAGYGFTIGNQTCIADDKGLFTLPNGNTILPGSTLTIAGTTVNLDLTDTAVVINGHTSTMSSYTYTQAIAASTTAPSTSVTAAAITSPAPPVDLGYAFTQTVVITTGTSTVTCNTTVTASIASIVSVTATATVGTNATVAAVQAPYGNNVTTTGTPLKPIMPTISQQVGSGADATVRLSALSKAMGVLAFAVLPILAFSL